MSKETDWFSSMVDRKVTVTEIATYLGVTRRTATNRVSDGMTADDLITVSRKLGLSPIHALVELGKITLQEAFDFVDGDGRLLESAGPDELLFQLAKESLPVSLLIDLGNDGRDRVARQEVAEAKAKHRGLSVVSTPDDSINDDDGTVRDFDWDEPHAADNSPDEDALREERGEDPIG